MPLGCALAAVLALLPPINWKRTDSGRLQPALLAGLGALLLAAIALVCVGSGVLDGCWGSSHGGLDRVEPRGYDVFRRRKALSRAYVGMSLAHLGFAVCIIGIAITSTQSIERDVRMVPQDQVELDDMIVTFLGVSAVNGPNYRAQQGTFVVANGDSTFSLRPEKRQYLAGGNVMTEAGIHAGLLGDTYIALGEPLDAEQGALGRAFALQTVGALDLARCRVNGFRRYVRGLGSTVSNAAYTPASIGNGSGIDMTRLRLFVPLILFLLICGVGYVGFSLNDRHQLPSALLDKPFPEFNAVSLLDVGASNHQGGLSGQSHTGQCLGNLVSNL